MQSENSYYECLLTIYMTDDSQDNTGWNLITSAERYVLISIQDIKHFVRL